MRIAPVFALCAALGGSAAGCASIWGFEDAVDVRDGGSGGGAQGACTCVPSAPEGWTGPFEIFEANGNASDSPDASCGPDYMMAYVGLAAASAPRAVCTCSCGPPEGACGAPVVTLFKDGMCSQSCGSPAQTIGPGCTPLNVSGECKGGGTHFTLETAVPSGGSCTPVATQVIGPATRAGRAVLCAPKTPPVVATCAAGSVCAAAADPKFEPETRCILREGARSCPAAYPNLRTYYGPDTDSRACTACTCGAPSGLACENVSALLYPGPACLPAGSMVAPSSGCPPLQGMVSAAPSGATPASAGQCAPAGGQPSGAVTPGTQSTICCTP
jgi:hypothetical protein